MSHPSHARATTYRGCRSVGPAAQNRKCESALCLTTPKLNIWILLSRQCRVQTELMDELYSDFYSLYNFRYKWLFSHVSHWWILSPLFRQVNEMFCACVRVKWVTVWKVLFLTVFLQISLKSGDELPFVSLGLQTSGIAFLPQFSKLQIKKHLLKPDIFGH